MQSQVAAPQTGDTLIVQILTKRRQCMELSGYIEEVSEDYVYFSMDAIHFIRGPISDFPPLDGKTWPKTETKALRMGVHLNDMKLFSEDGGDVVWLVSV